MYTYITFAFEHMLTCIRKEISLRYVYNTDIVFAFTFAFAHATLQYRTLSLRARYSQEDERRSERSHRPEAETFEEGSDEGEYTDADDFIVDDDGRPITEKRKKKKLIFSDAYVTTQFFNSFNFISLFKRY